MSAKKEVVHRPPPETIIKRVRGMLDLTQEELAAKLKIKRSRLNMMEMEARPIPEGIFACLAVVLIERLDKPDLNSREELLRLYHELLRLVDEDLIRWGERLQRKDRELRQERAEYKRVKQALNRARG
jgi:DNA-binding XRE family transcriptional regulator